MGWSPLWNKLVMSSIWSESKEVKILWITLLAMKDRDGIVKGSLIGLANSARLSKEETVEAMRVLTNPDPYSSSPEHEGRRVQEITGGWKVLNHAAYRDMMQTEYRKEYNRVKQAEYRQKKRTPPLAGEIKNRQMQESGATEGEVIRHFNSFNRDEEGPL